MASRRSSVGDSLHAWWNEGVDWVRNQDSAESIVMIVAFVIVLVAGGIALLNLPDDRSGGTSTPPQGLEQPETNLVSFTNHLAGYGFEYPEAWTIAQRGTVTRLRSSNGRIDVTFGVSSSDRLERVATGLARSLNVTDIESIGTSQRRIGGDRAFLWAGITHDETGRAIRFIAIAVDGDRRTYTILIAVPVSTDPARVLPMVERVVASFDTSGVDAA